MSVLKWTQSIVSYWKRSNDPVMIALTWCAQLCELYSCTKLFCLLDQVPVNWVFGLLYLANPLILSLFSSSFNPGRCFLTFTAVFLTVLRMSASTHSDIQWRKWNRDREINGLTSLQAPVWCWHYEQSLFPVASGMLQDPVWCCSLVHSSLVSCYVKNAGCASLLSGQRVFTHLIWLSSITARPLLGEQLVS